jgi:hypothetical protein
MAYQTFSRHRPLADRLAVLTWMLDHGADVNGQLHGWTPLMGTASAYDIDTAKLLVARGANPNLSGAYLPPVAVAANSCVNVTRADAVDARLTRSSRWWNTWRRSPRRRFTRARRF